MNFYSKSSDIWPTASLGYGLWICS